MDLGFCFDILCAQRCWWGCTKNKRHIWRRNVVRRYVLEDEQREYGFINGNGKMGLYFIYTSLAGYIFLDIFYIFIVGCMLYIFNHNCMLL